MSAALLLGDDPLAGSFQGTHWRGRFAYRYVGGGRWIAGLGLTVEAGVGPGFSPELGIRWLRSGALGTTIRVEVPLCSSCQDAYGVTMLNGWALY